MPGWTYEDPSGWTVEHPQPKAAPPPTFAPTSDYSADMDRLIGKGRWKDTGDYRSPARESQLRAQGAGTVRPGGVSAHSRGSPDAPGAHDFVPQGEGVQDALGRLKGQPGIKDAFYEAQSGTQGGHIHVDMADAAGWKVEHPAAKGWTFERPGSGGADATPAKPAPAAAPDAWNPGADFTGPIRAAAHQVMQDARANLKGKSTSPGGIMDIPHVLGVPLSVLTAAVNVPIQAAARAIEATGVPIYQPGGFGKRVTDPVARRAQIAAALGTATMAVGPEGGEAGVTEALAGADAANLRATSLPKPAQAPKPGPISQGLSQVRKVVAPATVSQTARDAAALHRSVLGKWGITSDKESYVLAKNARALRKLTPDQTRAFIDYVERRSEPGARPPDAASQDLGPGQAYEAAKAPATPMERARAKTRLRIEDVGESTPLRQAADAIRDLSDRYKARIQYVLGTEPEGGPQFVRDYYTHLWKEDPKTVEARMQGAYGGRQGSGRNLRQRSIPTYAEGLERGLTPKYPNPIDAMTAYNENMANFLATHDIKGGMVDSGLAGWHRPGRQPPGWVELNGALTKRRPPFPPRGAKVPGAELPQGGDAAITDQRAAPQGPPRLEGPRPPGEAPQGQIGDQGGRVAPYFAESQGRVGGEPGVVQIEDAAAKARKVGGTEEAAAPGKRARDVAPDYEQLYAPADAARIYNNHISRGLDQGDVGPIYRGARAAVNGLVQLKLGLSAFHLSVMSQEGIVSEFAKGWQQLSQGRVLKGLGSMAASPAAPVRLAMRGGKMFRQIVGEEAPSEFDQRLNDVYERAGGRLGMSRIYSPRASGSFFTSLARGTLARDVKASLGRVFGDNPDLIDRGKGIIDLAGNLIQSAAAPIFEKFVPATKRGAWARRMEDFIKANPDASEDAVVKKGREVLDSVDNRFGELMVDNNFWHKTGFQIAQLMLLSPGWDIGTVRDIGGGVTDIPKSLKGLATGKGITDKTAYVVGLLSVTVIQNAVATYLHTGKTPEGMDFFAYRTGGVNPDGSPERALIPSYMKDIMGLIFEGLGRLAENKVNPGLKEAWELSHNQDYRGYPITAALPGEKGVADYLAEESLPISLERSSQTKTGSKLSAAERAAAIRPAPYYLQNPERVARQSAKHDLEMHKRKRKADQRQDAQYAP
jgi:hypothetical protein